MIVYHQVKKSVEIASLTDYYVLDVRTTGPNPAVNAISSVAMLQVKDDIVIQEADVRITAASDSEADTEPGYYHASQISESLSQILSGQVVVAEPVSLQFLRGLLEKYNHDAEIRFVPIDRLVNALFPDMHDSSILEMARKLEIPELENAGLMRTAYFEYELFLRCKRELGADVPVHVDAEADAKRRATSGKHRISSRTLKRWAKSVWSVSPWVVIGLSFLLVLVFIINLPRKENTEIDRNTAPVNYLVLNWDQTGKYGTKPRSRSGEDSRIQFRVPYGVYNVLNNNSIPVELNIITDDGSTPESSPVEEGGDEEAATESAVTAKAAELTASTGRGATDVEEEEEDSRQTKITMRPNSTRQIIIDTDQYLTLSDDARDLILFYVSEVPEEKESDTTGRDDGSGNRVVYAYVKGTEVRFRKSPSLEGAIIDSMQNGQQVQVLGVTGEWTHVSVQNEKGYIFSQFLTSEDPQAAAYAAKKAEEEAAKLAEETANQAEVSAEQSASSEQSISSDSGSLPNSSEAAPTNDPASAFQAAETLPPA